MALTAAQYTAMFSTSNSDADYLTSDEISEIENDFNSNDYLTDKDKLLQFGPMLHMIQKITEELDYLRSIITVNKAKTSFPGLGTSNSTALAGDTTTISTSQASAITANTAKVTFPGLGTTSTTALAGNTKIPSVTVTSDQGLVVNFGNLKVGKISTTADLTITDHTGKSPVTYTTQLTLK